jgi:hypothetical protein
MKHLLIFCFICFSLSFSQTKNDSSDGGAGIVYGKDHAFIISAPKGWILDNSSGVSQGLYAVFYPIGGSWEKSQTVMYVNTASRTVNGNETINKLIEFDIKRFKSNYSDVKIGNLPSVVTKDNKNSIIVTFEYKQYEAVAYIEEEAITVLLVLSTDTKEQFQSTIPAFRDLISSYQFLTKDVH